MLLGFKTQLKLTPQQRRLLPQHAGVAPHAWNLGLAPCQNLLTAYSLLPITYYLLPNLDKRRKDLTCQDWGMAFLGGRS
ncbi:helix-turn-helix domain-containing protein [Spirulina subsalsa FACHB-351]|uniref:Helix-turn-helix domain-containing protein n=1 Tax=Spirulina subsalsa FACHB-351 TaxID=234711 RepID=A0ABT3L9U2_9CYAN|nr:helix-turn-helix domain-containing protein [Spirulina subsalsa FACHB-351]